MARQHVLVLEHLRQDDAAVDQRVGHVGEVVENEAIGVTRAAQAAGMPVAISFTVETDGRLPTGQSLREAIEEVDAATSNGPANYISTAPTPRTLK